MIQVNNQNTSTEINHSEINSWEKSLYPLIKVLNKRPSEWISSYETRSLNAVGSIYTSQGIEFDYVGFVWGNDLKWDTAKNIWNIDISAIKDPQLKN